MKLKAFALALLLAVGAMTAPVNALTDPTPAPPPSSLSCIKAQSDVAMQLRITNDGTATLKKGKTIHYAYKTSAATSLIEGDETLSLTLTNPVGATLGAQSVAQLSITDNDNNANAPNAIDGVPNFVRQHYHDFLNREPDPVGFQGWQDILNNCAPGNAACDRIEVSSAFYRSAEFHDRGYFVYRFYSASLGRIPQYLEFMRDLQKVSGFLSVQEQEAAKLAFITEFMN